MLLFSFSIFSDLKIENENNIMKTLTAEVSDLPGWLRLPLTETNFHGPKRV